jgi:hypothetical protein
MHRWTALTAIIMAGIALQLGACAKSDLPGASNSASGNGTLAAPAAAAAPVFKTATLPAGTSAGVRIYFDPVTGEQRAPTDKELAAEAQRASEVNANSAPVTPALKVQERVLPGGLIEVQIDHRADVQERACVEPDGSLSGDCPPPSAKLGKAQPP